MTPRKKILNVLTQIKRDSALNADGSMVRFDLNHHIAGAGILTNDEEARILCKLRNLGYIEIPLPEHKGMVTSVTDEETIARQASIRVILGDNFHFRYFFFKLFTFDETWWKYTNPLWIVTKLIEVPANALGLLWHKSKILTSIIGAAGALLVYDWTLAWQNAENILNFLKSLL
jgi:hypothetical protein